MAKQRKHGMSTDPIYLKWLSINARCYDPSNTNYGSSGALGIKVDQEWTRYNPEGFYNFNNWLENQLKHFNLLSTEIALRRRDTKKNFSSNNCYIVHKNKQFSKNIIGLNDSLVIKLRKTAKQWPRPTLAALSDAVKIPAKAVSEAIRGITHKHLDSIESPFKRN